MCKTCSEDIYPPILQPSHFPQRQARLCSFAYTPRSSLCIACVYSYPAFLLSSVSWQSFYVVMYDITFPWHGLHRITLYECIIFHLICTLLRDILGGFQSLPCTRTSICRWELPSQSVCVLNIFNRYCQIVSSLFQIIFH